MSSPSDSQPAPARAARTPDSRSDEIPEPGSTTGAQSTARADEASAGPEPPEGARARAVRHARAGAGDVVDTVVSAGNLLGDLTRPVVDRVRPTVRAAVRRWREREAARIRRLRARNKEPLPNLYELHPEARLAQLRELGLTTIPIDEIVGTAVAGPAQRGRDFLPPPRFRTSNWVGRWQRIRKAMDRLAILPPIEVLKTADGYWVVDGHNRVGAALYGNQLAIDALVTAVRLPGEPVEPPSGSLAAMLEGAGGLQAAAAGRLTPGSTIEEHGFEHRPVGDGADLPEIQAAGEPTPEATDLAAAAPEEQS